MNAVKNLVARLVKDEQGQDLIEYALLATFVSLVAIAGATLLGTALNNCGTRRGFRERWLGVGFGAS